MRRVIVESPFAGNALQRLRHRAYARAALFDCLARGEAPFAAHLLYTQVLHDAVPADRRRGFVAGQAWTPAADLVAVYIDRGISRGMIDGIEAAARAAVAVEYRALDWPAVLSDADTMAILGRLRQMARDGVPAPRRSLAYGNPTALIASAADAWEKQEFRATRRRDRVAARKLLRLVHSKTPAGRGSASP